jgi:hypothetical protein
MSTPRLIGLAVVFLWFFIGGIAHFALIDLPSFYLQGKSSLFAAHRLADQKNGQLVTFELEADAAKFTAQFVPD